jgi:integrase
MATVKAFIRVKHNSNKAVNVRFRLSDGRGVQLFHKSDLRINPELWNPNKECQRASAFVNNDERLLFNSKINGRKEIILDVYNSFRPRISDSRSFEALIDQQLNPGKYEGLSIDFFDLFDLFLKKHKLSQVRINNYLVVKRALMRYELYCDSKKIGPYKLDVNKISAEDIQDIENFLLKEHDIYKEHPDIYAIIPECRPPKPRGRNTINDIMGKIKTFFIWLNENEFTTNNPFKKFIIGEFIYGTPYYITLEERDKIMNFNLSKFPVLSLHRDIFIFQCLIGCRMGDLWSMTYNNIVNGAIEYIARKTKEDRPITIRVPLNSKAKEILARHKGEKTGKLFPFPSAQRYNLDIKTIFKMVGINRIVTYINPTTRETEQRPISEIASSHLARRTFVGNLYKKVLDPNLVSSLSGHTDGSKAFSRYRDIDDHIKEELVQMID